MKENDLLKLVLMKQDVKLALEVFKKKYNKVSKGIQKLYEEIILSDDVNKVQKDYVRFFGYMKKSKRAKDKWGA